MCIWLSGKANRGKSRQSGPEKAKRNKVEYIILALMLLFSFVYFLMPIHIRMIEMSGRRSLGVFFTPDVLFQVSLIDRGYVLKSDQIITKNFSDMGMYEEQLLLEVSRKRPVILVVEDDDLDNLTDRKLVVVEDIYKGSSNFLAQYLYPPSYKRKRTSITLHKLKKPEQTALYAFLRKSYFLGIVKEGSVTALYDRCQREVRRTLLSKGYDWNSFPEKD